MYLFDLYNVIKKVLCRFSRCQIPLLFCVEFFLYIRLSIAFIYLVCWILHSYVITSSCSSLDLYCLQQCINIVFYSCLLVDPFLILYYTVSEKWGELCYKRKNKMHLFPQSIPKKQFPVTAIRDLRHLSVKALLKIFRFSNLSIICLSSICKFRNQLVKHIYSIES